MECLNGSSPACTIRACRRQLDCANRAQRDRRRILIDGARELGRALDAGATLVEVFVCPERLSSVAGQSLVRRLQSAGVPLVDVAPHVFEKLAYGDASEGVVAVAETPQATLANLRLPDRPLVAVLEACEKPGNLGAVLAAPMPPAYRR